MPCLLSTNPGNASNTQEREWVYDVGDGPSKATFSDGQRAGCVPNRGCTSCGTDVCVRMPRCGVFSTIRCFGQINELPRHDGWIAFQRSCSRKTVQFGGRFPRRIEPTG